MDSNCAVPVVHHRRRADHGRAECADRRTRGAAYPAAPYGARAARERATVPRDRRAEPGSVRPVDQRPGGRAHAHRTRSARRRQSTAGQRGHHVERSQAKDPQGCSGPGHRPGGCGLAGPDHTARRDRQEYLARIASQRPGSRGVGGNATASLRRPGSESSRHSDVQRERRRCAEARCGAVPFSRGAGGPDQRPSTRECHNDPCRTEDHKRSGRTEHSGRRNRIHAGLGKWTGTAQHRRARPAGERHAHPGVRARTRNLPDRSNPGSRHPLIICG